MQIYNALQAKAGAKTEYNKMGTLNQPIQFLPRSKKDEDWAAWCLDWLEWQGLKMVRRNARRLMKNYKLAKGIIDRSDYIIEEDNENADLIDTLTRDDISALELKFYPIIPNVINTLTSEFSKRVTRVTYSAVDENSYNEMLELKKSQVEQVLMFEAQQRMNSNMMAMGIDPESEEYGQAMAPENLKTLPEIEAFFQKDYRSMVEQWAEHQHKVDVERFGMDELEERGFRDLLITDREFWHFKMMEDDYEVELWNPVLTFYQKSPDRRYMSDSNWVGKYDMMTVADVIDKYGWLMTEEQMASIELIYPVRSAGYPIQGYQNDGSYYDGTKSHEWNTNMPSLGYRQFTSMWDSAVYGGDIVNWIMMENEDYLDLGMSNLLRVTTVYWKSQRKVGHLTKITESGEVISDIIDEDYKPIYLGIDNNHIGPLKFQFKGENSLYGCKLPVEGSVFSDRNTRSTALVDLMKPFQIAYNIVNNQIADILIDELGTVIMLDQNSLPRHSLGEDWGKSNYAKAYVAMKNFQVLPLDTSITNTENALNFNHFQKLDMSQTERLMSRVQLAQYFKQQAFEVIGITPQRLGQEITRQTATGIEQSINASYAQTETYFIQHCDYLMPRVHQMRTDLAQYYHSTKPSTRLKYITTLDEQKNFQINGTDLLLRELNIFATTKANQRAILEQLKQLSITNNTSGASIYDLGNIMKSESIAEVTHILKENEKKMEMRRKEEMAQEQQMQEQALMAKAEEERMKLEFEATENDKDRKARILEAQIKAAGYGSMADLNENQQSDYIDALDRIQKTQNYQDTMNLNREKESNKIIQSREKIQVEKEKINAQKEIANIQLKIAEENKNKYDVSKKDKDKNKKSK